MEYTSLSRYFPDVSSFSDLLHSAHRDKTFHSFSRLTLTGSPWISSVDVPVSTKSAPMYITASLCLLITAIIIYFTNKYYQYKKALKSIPGSEDVSLSTRDANFRSKLTKLIDGHREDGVFKLKINNEINVIISTKELIRDFLCPSNSKSVQKEARTDCPFKSSLICLQDSEEWKNMRRLLTCSFLFRSVYDLNNQLNFISRKVINTFSNNNNYIHEYNDGGNDISCPAIKMREMVTGIVLDTIFGKTVNYL